MIRLIFIVSVSILFSACKKESKSVDEIRYEVKLTHSSTWSGLYMNQNGQTVDINNMPGDWQISFKNTEGLIAATLLAISNDRSYPYFYPDADATMNVYVNDILVASKKYSIDPGGIIYDLH